MSGPRLGHPEEGTWRSSPSSCTPFSTPPRPRELAEFYRQLLGLRYRPGDEPPTDGAPDEADWLVLVDSAGARKLAFQQVDRLSATTWPEHDVPMQLHVDFHGLEPC